MTFKPYPGLTIATLISLAILITLGTWQMQRLEWKTQLLADIDVAAESAPFESAGDIDRALNDSQPVDFRRINLSGTYEPSGRNGRPDEYHVFKIKDKQSGWRIFKPVHTEGKLVFIATDWVADGAKPLDRTYPKSAQYFSGYVRTYEKPSRFAAKSTPEKNRWFSFNATPDVYDWAETVHGDVVETRYYIDAVSFGGGASIEILPVKKPDIRNNHFDYMLTWYSFALILLFIYTLLHIRGNRLTFRRSP